MNAQVSIPEVPSNYEQVQPRMKPNLALIYAGAGAHTAGSVASQAAAQVRPAVRKLPGGRFLSNRLLGGDKKLKHALQLPQVAHVVEGLIAHDEWHQEFCRVVHATAQPLVPGSAEDQVFSGALHVLAFPAIMSVITRSDFPLPAMGMVHLDNQITHLHPVAVGEPLTVTTWAEDLRAHRAGTAVTLNATLMRDDGTVVWGGRSTFLAKGVHAAIAGEGTREPSGSKHAERPTFEPPHQTAQWRLGAGTGREYAKVSGDYNPIHLTQTSARALGMKGAIAHGMYTASRALATAGIPAGVPMQWSVEFAAPVVLPATVAVSAADDGRGQDWTSSTVTVWDPEKNRPHMQLDVSRM